MNLQRYNEESRIGLFLSIGVHAAVLFILALIPIRETFRRLEFIEVSFGSGELQSTPSGYITSPAPQREKLGAIPEGRSVLRVGRKEQGQISNRPVPLRSVNTPMRAKAPSLSGSQRVALPLRSLSAPDEKFLMPEAVKKLSAESKHISPDSAREIGAIFESIRSGGDVLESRKSPETFIGRGNIQAPVGAGSVGKGKSEASGIGYAVQWTAGGFRKALSTPLPHYPEGVNREGEIQLRAIIASDGSVKHVEPLLKVDASLEQAAMKKVRLWKFEPLPASLPQVDQTCKITFYFRLK
ncbi:MAG: energy transducer TonB [Bacteroidota bacterium]